METESLDFDDKVGKTLYKEAVPETRAVRTENNVKIQTTDEQHTPIADRDCHTNAKHFNGSFLQSFANDTILNQVCQYNAIN